MLAIVQFSFTCCNSLYASVKSLPADTSRKKMLADNIFENKVTIKETNVVFPEIISGHEKQSMDYIEKFVQNKRNYLLNIFSRSKKYFPKAKSILHKYNVPQEYVMLMALESGFKSNVVSSAGAVGYWQFMDEVAKEYGLRVAQKNMEKKIIHRKGKKITISKKRISPDDRKNFIKSTIAAARYLQDRMKNLDNDWLLVAASYNCGVGNVWDAMKRTGKTSPDFWDIKKYLPAETRAYVMNFITLNVISNNYENFCNNNMIFRNVSTEITLVPSVVFMD